MEKTKSTPKPKTGTVPLRSNNSVKSPKISAAPKSLKTGKPAKSTAAIGPPVTPAGYSGLPLVKKLGIKPGSTLTLLGEPPDFLKTLGKLPDKLKIRKTAQGERDLTVWFPRNASELKRRIESLAAGVADGGLWIAWPKQAGGIETDLTQDLIRSLGLQQGIVDYKICAIDDTFSGLKFGKRKTK